MRSKNKGAPDSSSISNARSESEGVPLSYVRWMIRGAMPCLRSMLKTAASSVNARSQKYTLFRVHPESSLVFPLHELA